MKLAEAKVRFIQTWGGLGSSWGISRTMAQIHALLLIATEPLSAEEVMSELNISRGNANMNLRALIDWGLVRKEHKLGERREYFVAEKDIWRVATQVIRERRKRELKPVLQVLEELQRFEDDANEEEVKVFQETIGNLTDVVSQADTFLEWVIRVERSRFVKSMIRLLGKKKEG